MKTASFVMFLIENGQAILVGLSALLLAFALNAYLVCKDVEKDYLEGSLLIGDPMEDRIYWTVISPILVVGWVFSYIDSFGGSGID